jgi:hypothetical protein
MSFLKAVDNKNRKLFLAIGIAVLAAILFIGGWIFVSKSGFFYKKVDTGSQKFSLDAQMYDVTRESDLQRGYMITRYMQVLQENRGVGPWVLNWVVIPGTTRSVPGFQSQYVDAFDQVLLLETYVIEGKKSDAEKLMKAIEANLLTEDGYLCEFAKVQDLSVKQDEAATTYDANALYEDPSFLLLEKAPASLRATSSYLRVLMDYYDKWGSEKLLDRIKELAAVLGKADKLTEYRVEDRLARPTTVPVSEILEATPTPTPTPDPENKEAPKLVSQDGLELQGLDLLAMKRAGVIDPVHTKTYEKWLSIVKNGMISETLPLYAWVYLGEEKYCYYTGSNADVELVPSLYTMVHLAEVGELDAASYSWIQMKLMNTGYLYTKYNMLSGEASGEVEAYEAYPLVLELAVIKNDQVLFEMAYSAMMRHYATLSTSQILYTYYRDVDDSRIELCARENLLAAIFLK